MKIRQEKFVLISFALFTVVLIILRIIRSSEWRYASIAWNLFLAFVPLLLSNLLWRLKGRMIFHIPVAALWLLFFPNSFYLITDLIHLEEASGAPLWYDAMLLFSASVTGVLCALISFSQVMRYAARHIRKGMYLHILASLLMFASAFGVYLGRFSRWNSWDIFIHPIALTADITKRFLFPGKFMQTWVFTAVATVLFYLLNMLTGAFGERRRTNNF